MDNKLTNINSFIEDLRTSNLSKEELFEKAKSLYDSE